MKRFIAFFGFSLIVLASALIYAQALPDLDLQNVSCLKGKLYFIVINRGAPLPAAGWRAVADVYFDGIKKGHIDLGAPTSRTGGGIDNSGGTSSYLTAFDITAPVTVDINIDATNSINESNEDNNFRRGAHLKPCDEAGKTADWKIVGLKSEPKCYNTPPPGAPDFIYTILVEFKAASASRPPGDLVVEAQYISNIETTTKPPINLSELTRAWSSGASDIILWDGDKIEVRKVSPMNFMLKKPDCHIGPRVVGDTKTTVKAHTKDPSGMRLTDTKTLVFGPCQAKPKK